MLTSIYEIWINSDTKHSEDSLATVGLLMKLFSRCTLGLVVCFKPKCAMEFFLNVSHWIRWTKIHDIKRTQTCHPATSCVRDQHATTAPARHMWQIGSLNWTHSCFSDLSVSLSSLNSVKVLLHLDKTPIRFKRELELKVHSH